MLARIFYFYFSKIPYSLSELLLGRSTYPTPHCSFSKHTINTDRFSPKFSLKKPLKREIIEKKKRKENPTTLQEGLWQRCHQTLLLWGELLEMWPTFSLQVSRWQSLTTQTSRSSMAMSSSLLGSPPSPRLRFMVVIWGPFSLWYIASYM